LSFIRANVATLIKNTIASISKNDAYTLNNFDVDFGLQGPRDAHLLDYKGDGTMNLARWNNKCLTQLFQLIICYVLNDMGLTSLI